jgi:hypothetical protein
MVAKNVSKPRKKHKEADNIIILLVFGGQVNYPLKGRDYFYCNDGENQKGLTDPM